MKNIKYVIFTLILFMSAEIVSASKVYDLEDFVYFDPVTNNSCNETNYWTVYNQDTTCYRFIVLDSNDTSSSSTLKIMLDHNVWQGRFDSYADNLKNATSNWKRHIGTVDIIDEETVSKLMGLTEKPTLDNISVNGGKPYLYFTTNSLYVVDSKQYAYWGFWTKDVYEDDKNYAYTITEFGNNRLVSTVKQSNGKYAERGIRPVITVNKSLLNTSSLRDITSFLENGAEYKFQYTSQKYDGYVYKQLQGFTFAKDNFIFHSANNSNPDYGLLDIYGYDQTKNTFTDLKKRVYSSTGHGNDLTYNVKSNSVVMVGPSEYNEIYIYDADNIDEETATLEKKIAYDTTGKTIKYSGIGYDANHNYYFALSSGRVYVLNSEFKQLYSFDAPANEVYQGMEYHNGYLYLTTFAYDKSNCKFCLSNPWASITYVYNAKFNSNGKPSNDFGRLVDRLYIGTQFGEIESVAFNGDNMYFGYAAAASKFNAGNEVYRFYSIPYSKVANDIDVNITYINNGSVKKVMIKSDEELKAASGWTLSSDKHTLSRQFSDSITVSNVKVCDLYKNCKSVSLNNITSNSTYLDVSDLDVLHDNMLIKNLKIGMSVNELTKKISTNGNLSILNRNNVKLSSTDKITSGSKVRVNLEENVYEYVLSVKGDINGDGKSTVTDVAKLYQFLKQKINMDDYYIYAGDLVGTDNQIKVNDVAKLYQFIKGKISSLM